MAANFNFSTAASAVETTGGYVIDSKAMRKVGIDDDAVSLFSMRPAVGAFLQIEGRQLIQLH